MSYIKLNFQNVEEVERMFSIWIFKRRYRIVFFAFVVFLLLAFSLAPYVNLILNTYLIIFISSSLAPFILDLDVKLLITMGVTLFILTFFLLLTAQTEEAEFIAEYIFVILFSGSLKALF